MRFPIAVIALLLTAATPATAQVTVSGARTTFTRAFAPAEGMVKASEKPYRQELCLNGRWQFQPVPVPADFKRDTGISPDLPLPKADGWDATPIKIPSPWNVNRWGTGRDVGAGTERPYWPDSVYFPSYPAAWDNVEMGWLRRTFRVPTAWRNRRIVLHFEAVAGECRILVNGKPAGEHFDKYLPFDLDITSLVQRDGDNELLVGVRAHHLFNKVSARYSKMRAPYPTGSETERLAGIWHDVFLLGLPPVRVQDAFVKPLVAGDTLEVDVTLRNDSNRSQTVSLTGEVQPWINQAGTDVLSAPEPRWKLGNAVLALPGQNANLPPGATTTVTLRQRVGGKLKLWAPGTPNLHMAVLSIRQGGQMLDTQCTRFGWRQFKLSSHDLLLNGKKIQLAGDLLHPFGPFIMSRRYVWAWYRMIQDMGGNCVRPHAQIHPRHYLDLADEMGLVVLDETALFGSSIQLNFEEPVAWERFADHYDGLVLRDRNHPSVVGWSFGNELFAIFNLNNVTPEDANRWHGQLAELGLRARRLDPTREWISCDGDEDLRGTLPVWSKHFGHGTPLDRLPNMEKPLMVGESGGSYYARPSQLAMFNGERAYESYAGRNEALAIDVYDNITRMARPRLSYYSASETAWFGLEHLNFGFHDFSRLPGKNDGVFFTHPFEEGRSGMQPERLPPYVATLNPGWDLALPLYKPLAMFQAQKAALAKNGPLPSPWDHKTPQPPRPLFGPLAPPSIEHVTFIGQRTGPLGHRLAALGVLLDDTTTGDVPATDAARHKFFIIDSDGLTDATLPQARRVLSDTKANGGTVLLMIGDRAREEQLQVLLDTPLYFTERTATMLVPNGGRPLTASLTLPELYFAEDGADRFIMRRGLDGPLVTQGRVLLSGSDTDWALFNNAPEVAKCAALVLYEHLKRPSGAALVEGAHGKGRLLVSSLNTRIASRNAGNLWRTLFWKLGVKLGAPQGGAAAFDDNGALINALSIGRFAAPTLEAALTENFIDETTPPKADTPSPNAKTPAWQPVTSPSKDRFVFPEMKQPGPAQGAFATYFSYWIRSPRALDDLLTGGPDAPRFTTLCYASEKCRLFLNGKEFLPARTEPADYRTRYQFDNLPLQKGWNHFLVKVASTQLAGEHPATLAVRILSNSQEYLQQLDSAVETPPPSAPGAASGPASK